MIFFFYLFLSSFAVGAGRVVSGVLGESGRGVERRISFKDSDISQLWWSRFHLVVLFAVAAAVALLRASDLIECDAM